MYSYYIHPRIIFCFPNLFQTWVSLIVISIQLKNRQKKKKSSNNHLKHNSGYSCGKTKLLSMGRQITWVATLAPYRYTRHISVLFNTREHNYCMLSNAPDTIKSRSHYLVIMGRPKMIKTWAFKTRTDIPCQLVIPTLAFPHCFNTLILIQEPDSLHLPISAPQKPSGKPSCCCCSHFWGSEVLADTYRLVPVLPALLPHPASLACQAHKLIVTHTTAAAAQQQQIRLN